MLALGGMMDLLENEIRYFQIGVETFNGHKINQTC